MQIQTKYLGDIKIDTQKLLHFPSGLPGFKDEMEFIMLDLPGNNVFQVLQSTKTAALAFITTNPYQFYNAYIFKLDDSILENLQIKDEGDVTIFSIVTLREPFINSTLNLKAPIVLNTTKRLGKQYILNTDAYQTKAPITSPESNERQVD